MAAGPVARISRALAYALATAVIALALLVGVLRLLLPLVPEYREEVRRIAAAATGLDVEFDDLSASWPLAGPEIRLYGVRLLDPRDGAALLEAREADVGLSLLELLRDRRLAPSRVAVIGTGITVERDAGGTWRLQGRPVAELLERRAGPTSALPEVDVRLADVRLRYRDVADPDATLDLSIDRLRLEFAGALIAVSGSARLDALDATVELDLAVPAAVARGQPLPEAAPWGGVVELRRADLAPLARLALGVPTPLVRAPGSVMAELRFAGPRLEMLRGDVALETVELAGGARYERIAGRAAWDRRPSGWEFSIAELEIERNGAAWPAAAVALAARAGPPAGPGTRLTAEASFLRLDDLAPLAAALLGESVRARWFPPRLEGDLAALRVDAELGGPAPRYSLAMDVDGLAVALPGGAPALFGVTGRVAADQDGGRLEIASEGPGFALPRLFSAPIELDRVDGLLLWRVTEDRIRVLSDSIRVRGPALAGSSRFEFSLPRDGGSPVLELDASAASPDATVALRYLPIEVFPPAIGRWLKRAIQAGRLSDGRIQFRGPLTAFPFRNGEGVFRAEVDVAGGVLDYADGWPAVEDIEGRLVFEGLSLSSDANRGRIAGILFEDRTVRIPDLTRGELLVSGAQRLAFAEAVRLLRALPIAAPLDPVLARVRGGGAFDTRLDLRLPLLRPRDAEVDVVAVPRSVAIGLAGLGFRLEALAGELRARNTRVTASGLTARLLGEPVGITIRAAAPASGGYGHFALFEGRNAARDWGAALGLPLAERFEGAADWRAMALVPGIDGEPGPLRLLVRSRLDGVASRLPGPLDKPADRAERLDLALGFPGDAVEVAGRLARGVSWALRFEPGPAGLAVERGAVSAGLAPAVLPTRPGIEVSGRIDALPFDAWLELAGETSPEGESGVVADWTDRFRELALEIGELRAFGYRFPDTEVYALRADRRWTINLDGPAVMGTVGVPLPVGEAGPLDLDLDRLWLTDPLAGPGGDGEPGDPRRVPAARVAVGDFRLAALDLGALRTELVPVPNGISAAAIETTAPAFTLRGEGSWLAMDGAGPDAAQRTQLRLVLDSKDVQATLTRLGYRPIMEGQAARAEAELRWPGPPDAEFLGRVSGSIALRIDEGALLEVEPGGGRLLGVLSVAALPRRLALDFSDVVEEGLSFDRIQGAFRLENGDAYTCDLGLEGQVADLGIVGRAGLATEDYDQLAVVRPHVSNVLALGGAVVGGPTVGAALLLISQIFRKPLSALGESYYRVTGGWDQPEVERIQRSDVDASRYAECERYLAEILPVPPDELELRIDPPPAPPAPLPED